MNGINTGLPRLSQFNDAEYAEAYPPGVENTFWHLARCSILAGQLRTAGSRRVLDVGCGRGILIDSFVKSGIDCHGVELAPVKVPAHLEARIATGVAAEDLDASFRASIDTIILGDVIEHIREPQAFLTTLRTAYPNLETLIVAVPARKELWSNYDEHYGHYRRYDLDLLKSTVEGAGYTVAASSYMFRLLYPPTLALLKLGRKRQTRISPGGESASLIHRTAAALLKSDFALLPAGWFGTSALCRATVKR